MLDFDYSLSTKFQMKFASKPLMACGPQAIMFRWIHSCLRSRIRRHFEASCNKHVARQKPPKKATPSIGVSVDNGDASSSPPSNRVAPPLSSTLVVTIPFMSKCVPPLVQGVLFTPASEFFSQSSNNAIKMHDSLSGAIVPFHSLVCRKLVVTPNSSLGMQDLSGPQSSSLPAADEPTSSGLVEDVPPMLMALVVSSDEELEFMDKLE